MDEAIIQVSTDDEFERVRTFPYTSAFDEERNMVSLANVSHMAMKLGNRCEIGFCGDDIVEEFGQAGTDTAEAEIISVN